MMTGSRYRNDSFISLGNLLLLFVVSVTPVIDGISWHNSSAGAIATSNREHLYVWVCVQITHLIIIWAVSAKPSVWVALAKVTIRAIIKKSPVHVMLVGVDGMVIIDQHTALLVGNIINRGILATAVVGVGGGVRSSAVGFDWVGAHVGIAHLVHVVGGSTVSTAASVLSVEAVNSWAAILLL